MPLWALTGLVAAAIVGSAMAPTLAGVFYDDGLYLALAKSLAEGNGYRMAHLPGAPAAVHYPFGYPAFLAALWMLWPSFPANLALLKGANAALVGVFAALTVRHLQDRLGPPRPWVALAVALGVSSVPLVAVATVLFAEPLFLVAAAGACWAADAARGSDGRRQLALAALAGLLAGAAALTRSIGVAVVAGVSLSLLRRRPGSAALAAGIAAMVLAPFMAWVAAHRGEVDPLTAANYGTYGQFIAQAGASWITVSGLGELGRPLAAIALPPLPAPARLALALCALALLVRGALLMAQRAPALGFTLLAYASIVAVWPYGPDRFVWAALPWLACAFVAGLERSLSRAEAPDLRRTDGPAWSGGPGRLFRRAIRPVALATGTAVLGWYAGSQAVGHARGAATATQRGISATMETVLPWIREATDSAAVIAGEDEALLWLYTGRRAVPSYLWRVRGRAAESYGPDSLKAYLERAGATHLVLTGPGSDAAGDLDALLARYPGYLEPVRLWPGGIMAFAIRRRG